MPQNLHMKWESAEKVIGKAINYSLKNKDENQLMGDLNARHSMLDGSNLNEKGKALAALLKNSQRF